MQNFAHEYLKLGDVSQQNDKQFAKQKFVIGVDECLKRRRNNFIAQTVEYELYLDRKLNPVEIADKMLDYPMVNANQIFSLTQYHITVRLKDAIRDLSSRRIHRFAIFEEKEDNEVLWDKKISSPVESVLQCEADTILKHHFKESLANYSARRLPASRRKLGRA